MTGTTRTAIVPGTDLEIAFGTSRVVLYNRRARNAVSMSRSEWEELAACARTIRTSATQADNKPGYWDAKANS